MTRTISIKKYLRIGALIGLFGFIAIYAIMETKSLTRGARVEVSGISDGAIFESEVLALSGRAIHANHLSLNGREILIDQENNFSEDIYLSPGYNIITLEAKDRFGKKNDEIYKVFYKVN